MARLPGAEPVYAVADAFRERCLRNGMSLLWPDVPAWSVGNIDALHAALIETAVEGGDQTFTQKLQVQLETLPLDAHRIAADARAVYYFMAHPNDIKPATKKSALRQMIDWKIGLDPEPPGWPEVEAAFDSGISSVGPFYKQSMFFSIAYLLNFASAVRRDPAILDDEDALIALANRLKADMPNSIAIRNAVLHLLLPERFERIVSNGHKQQIVAGFPDLRGSSDDLDDQLMAIRTELASQHPGRPFDFYDPEIEPIWRKDRDVERIRRMVESLVPDPEARQAALGLIADGILVADEARSSSWSLGLTGSTRLRFSVLWLAAATLDKTTLSLAVDASALTGAGAAMLDEFIDDEHGPHPYPSLPDATVLTIPHARLPETAPLIRPAWLAFVRDCAGRVRTRCHSHESHRPAAVRYLEEELGVELPQPDYGPGPDTARWWIEQTTSDGVPYRQDGPFAVGTAMVFPPPGATQLQHSHPAEVQPGDVVLHLENGAAFTALSRVERPLEVVRVEEVPEQMEWAVAKGMAGVVPLSGITPLDPPLARPAVFDDPQSVAGLRALDPGAIRGAFFRLTPSPGPNGHYHTPVHPALLDVLRDAYRRSTGRELVPEGWPMPDTEVVAESPLAGLSRRTHMTETELRDLRALLEDKRQLILEGPPGSGKTFVADLLARWVADAPLEGDAGGRVEIVQFHQSYGYEDFVQGIRPVTTGGALSYEMKAGVFLAMCERAREAPGETHVLIIDEINRGNLSRIFGELLMALEYRDRAVRLASGDTLAIPENLFVIGTMNSTDRSLALIDYALRRRFHFRRLTPVADGQAPVLARWLAAQGMDEAAARRVTRLFLALNERIAERLSPDFQVGHSYFMRPDIATEAGRRRVWNHGVLPLLAEYFHGARDREALLEEFSLARLDGGDSAASMGTDTATDLAASSPSPEGTGQP